MNDLRLNFFVVVNFNLNHGKMREITKNRHSTPKNSSASPPGHLFPSIQSQYQNWVVDGFAEIVGHAKSATNDLKQNSYLVP